MKTLLKTVTVAITIPIGFWLVFTDITSLSTYPLLNSLIITSVGLLVAYVTVKAVESEKQ